MYYEIIVMYYFRHFFATAKRSLHDLEQAKIVYRILREKFPVSEGYQIKVTKWEKAGRDLDWSSEL